MDGVAEAEVTWRPVVGWEGLYEVSSEGQVRSLPRKGRREARMLTPVTGKRGYLVVTLSREGRCRPHPIHRIVAEAFLGPRPDGMEVCHSDGSRLNNSVGNLRYGTSSQNKLDAVTHGTHVNARKTHCPKGHPYAGPNLIVDSDGKRRCRTCKNEKNRERRASWKTR